jgi:hypothetical protein
MIAPHQLHERDRRDDGFACRFGRDGGGAVVGCVVATGADGDFDRVKKMPTATAPMTTIAPAM